MRAAFAAGLLSLCLAAQSAFGGQCRISDVIFHYALMSSGQRDTRILTAHDRAVELYRTDPEFAAFVRSRMGPRMVAPVGKGRGIFRWIQSFNDAPSELTIRSQPEMRALEREFEGLSAQQRSELRARYPGERVELTEYLAGGLTARRLDSAVEWNSDGMLEYEARVALLSPGDTVVFGHRSFRLGRMLGAGNTTAVWELADFPDRVIRLPFFVGGIRGQVRGLALPGAGIRNRVAAMQGFLREYMKGAQRTLPQVRRPAFYEGDPNQGFLIVERIAIQETYSRWRERNWTILASLRLPARQLQGPAFDAEVNRVAAQLQLPPELVTQVARQKLRQAEMESIAAQAGFYDLHDDNWALDVNGDWVLIDFRYNRALDQ
jgi:hypothetical protein